MADRLDSYVEVTERLKRFYDKWEDGAIVTEAYEFVKLEGLPEKAQVGSNEKDVTANYVIVTALAYRSPTDPHPARGIAWERLPGRTPYTFEAELQNCETSAWGRAVAATGLLEEGESIASANEVRGRDTTQDGPATDKQKDWLRPGGRKAQQHGLDEGAYEHMFRALGISSIDELRFSQVDKLKEMIETGQIPGTGDPQLPVDMTGLEEYR